VEENHLNNHKKKDPKENSSQEPGNGSGLKTYAKYTGMGFQMLIIILIFTWAGSRLDERSANEKPVYTAILAILGVFVGLYTALKDFIVRKDD